MAFFVFLCRVVSRDYSEAGFCSRNRTFHIRWGNN